VEPGWGSFAGIFDRKEDVYLGSFLGPRGHSDFKSGGPSGTLIKEHGPPEIRLWGTKGPSLRPRCIRTIRAQTQY